MTLLRNAAKQIVSVVPVFVVVTFATFSMVRLLPGDPARAFLGAEAPEQQVQQLREQLRLDEPVVAGYAGWLVRLVTGDLGASYRTGQAVRDALAERLPVTLELVLLAQLLALVIAVAAALLSAHSVGRSFDRIWSASSFGLIAMPNFVLGALLIFVFPISLDLFRVAGYVPPGDGIAAHLGSIALPVVTLAALPVAIYSRVLRADLIATDREPFVLMAEAKGLSPMYIRLRHVMRPSSFSLLTLVGINIGHMIGGSVIVESLFGLPGLGSYLSESVRGQDIFALQGAAIVVVVGYLACNLVVDLLYSVVDPRVARGDGRSGAES